MPSTSASSSMARSLRAAGLRYRSRPVALDDGRVVERGVEQRGERPDRRLRRPGRRSRTTASGSVSDRTPPPPSAGATGVIEAPTVRPPTRTRPDHGAPVRSASATRASSFASVNAVARRAPVPVAVSDCHRPFANSSVPSGAAYATATGSASTSTRNGSSTSGAAGVASRWRAVWPSSVTEPTKTNRPSAPAVPVISTRSASMRPSCTCIRIGKADRAPCSHAASIGPSQAVAVLGVDRDEPVPAPHRRGQAGDLGEALVRAHDAVGRRAAEHPGAARQRGDVQVRDLIERVA